MTVVKIRCFLNAFFSMCSGMQGVFSWFMIWEQLLENVMVTNKNTNIVIKLQNRQPKMPVTAMQGNKM